MRTLKNDYFLIFTRTSNSTKVCLTKKNNDTDTEKYCNILKPGQNKKGQKSLIPF